MRQCANSTRQHDFAEFTVNTAEVHRERWAALKCLRTCQRSKRREGGSAGGKEENKKIVLLKIQHSASLGASAGEKIPSAGLSASPPVRGTMTRRVRARHPAGVCPHPLGCKQEKNHHVWTHAECLRTTPVDDEDKRHVGDCGAQPGSLLHTRTRTHARTRAPAFCVRACACVCA